MIRAFGSQAVAWTSQERNPDAMRPDERRALAMQLSDSSIAAIITDYPEQVRRVINVHRATDSVIAASR